jgi:hypothetical protein
VAVIDYYIIECRSATHEQILSADPLIVDAVTLQLAEQPVWQLADQCAAGKFLSNCVK